jgi:hypothetical protein
MLAGSLAIIEHTFVNQPRPSVTVFWEREFAGASERTAARTSVCRPCSPPQYPEQVTGPVLSGVAAEGRVVGAGLRFPDRGNHVLRGVPDPRRLYALER